VWCTLALACLSVDADDALGENHGFFVLLGQHDEAEK
jgi:hypothetical protein